MANPVSSAVAGIGYFFQGIGLITKPGVKKHVAVPLIINIILFSIGMYYLVTQYEALVDYLTPDVPDWLPDFITPLVDWFIGLLWVLFAAVALIIIFFTFTIVANIIGAPFNSYLSAAVERHLTGKNPDELETNIWKQTVASIGGELRKLGYLLMWSIVLLVISFIPVINFVSPFLWAAFGAWMLAIEYADYPLGNRGLTFPKIKSTLRTHRWLSLGFGGAATIATMIPLFNFLVMPVSVAGATAMSVKRITSGEKALDEPHDVKSNVLI